jgi:hypothetical protein
VKKRKPDPTSGSQVIRDLRILPHKSPTVARGVAVRVGMPRRTAIASYPRHGYLPKPIVGFEGCL